MFGALAEAIRDVDVPVDGDAIVELIGLRDRLDAKLTDSVGRFNRSQLWDDDGATSMTAWLKDRARMSANRARRCATEADKLLQLPVTGCAYRTGALSGDQVTAILNRLNPKVLPLFAEQEEALIPSLAPLPVGDVAVAMNQWREMADALDDDDEPPEKQRSLRLSTIMDGRGVLDGEFDADSTEVIRTALGLAEHPDTETDKDSGLERSPAERRADALVDLCRWFLDHQGHARGGHRRPHLNVLADLEDLDSDRAAGRYTDGTSVSPEVLQSLLCDSWLHGVFFKNRTVSLDYGTRTRLITPAMWATLVARDHHCRFPGCDRPPEWTEAHHVIHRRHGGPTRPDNLTLLCVRHHHVIHKQGWSAKLEPDGTLWISDPKGNIRTTDPPRDRTAFVQDAFEAAPP